MPIATPTENESPVTEDGPALERCQRGDAQAFEPIVSKYMRRAYTSALNLVGNHEDALDLSQDAFIRAYQALARFDIRMPFFTWYYRILRNLCLNHIRNQCRRRIRSGARDAQEPDPDELPAAPESWNPSLVAERNELTDHLWQTIAFLKPDEREILLLREMDGCSYAEIAARLAIPQGTVMSRLFYARKTLKERLAKIV